MMPINILTEFGKIHKQLLSKRVDNSCGCLLGANYEALGVHRVISEWLLKMTGLLCSRTMQQMTQFKTNIMTYNIMTEWFNSPPSTTSTLQSLCSTTMPVINNWPAFVSTLNFFAGFDRFRTLFT